MASKPREISEREASAEVERVFHEVKQVFRVSGVNLVFRLWASSERFFVSMWDAMRPNAETRAFEDAADHLREEAGRHARALGPLGPGVMDGIRLGPSPRYQLERALELYHYVNPKLLVFVSAVRMALDGEPLGARGARTERIERGIPARMAAMEMLDEQPDEPQLRALFKDIKKTLDLTSLNSDYRTLGLWPEYLEAAWGKLKPLVKRDDYRVAADALRNTARDQARGLPYPVPLSREKVAALGEDVDSVVELTRRFEQLLAPLVLNISLFTLDVFGPHAFDRSPFPAAPREEDAAEPPTYEGSLQ
jgi:hypothetical protein